MFIKGEFNLTPPTLGDKENGIVQLDSIGNLKVIQSFSYRNITLAAPTTTIVKSGAGFLHAIVINRPLASGSIVIYDALTAAAPIIGSIVKPAVLLSDAAQTIIYDVNFTTGLTIVTSGAAQDITVSYI